MKTDPSIPRILVVDDNLRNVQVLGGRLRQEGYDLVIARDGQQALEVAARAVPDLILLDVMMPVMDGYETCEALKADPALADIPVIFLTAKVEVSDIVRGFEAGGVDYVSKPFHSVELLSRVRTHLALRRQRRELEASYGALRELETLRDNMVHMLVHDMRSPLSGIHGYLDLVVHQSKTLVEDDRDMVQRALFQTRVLIDQVSDILDVSRMEAGKLELDLGSLDIRELLGESIDAIGVYGESVELLSGENVRFAGDRGLLRRVFQNLLGNAVKFSPADSKVQLSVLPSASELRIEVRDFGEGIPESEQSLIFEKFTQGRLRVGEAMRRFSSGLGLAFCRLAVEAHGGRIGVESEVGAGSTFWVVLPTSGESI